MPFCNVHMPKAGHTAVADSVDTQRAVNAPKAVRRAGDIKKDKRMSFYPGRGRGGVRGRGKMLFVRGCVDAVCDIVWMFSVVVVFLVVCPPRPLSVRVYPRGLPFIIFPSPLLQGVVADVGPSLARRGRPPSRVRWRRPRGPLVAAWART